MYYDVLIYKANLYVYDVLVYKAKLYVLWCIGL